MVFTYIGKVYNEGSIKEKLNFLLFKLNNDKVIVKKNDAD